MNLTRVEKSTKHIFTVEGECDFCHEKGTWEALVIGNRSRPKTRRMGKGAVFPWGAYSLSEDDITAFITGKIDKLRKKKNFKAGFPLLRFACPNCYRKKEEKQNAYY